MAANPIPPQDRPPESERPIASSARIPWGWIAAIITLAILGFLAYYYIW